MKYKFFCLHSLRHGHMNTVPQWGQQPLTAVVAILHYCKMCWGGESPDKSSLKSNSRHFGGLAWASVFLKKLEIITIWMRQLSQRSFIEKTIILSHGWIISENCKMLDWTDFYIILQLVWYKSQWVILQRTIPRTVSIEQPQSRLIESCWFHLNFT